MPGRDSLPLLKASMQDSELVLLPGSRLGRGFAFGLPDWAHKALGEDANPPITVALQPCLVHYGYRGGCRGVRGHVRERGRW